MVAVKKPSARKKTTPTPRKPRIKKYKPTPEQTEQIASLIAKLPEDRKYFAHLTHDHTEDGVKALIYALIRGTERYTITLDAPSDKQMKYWRDLRLQLMDMGKLEKFNLPAPETAKMASYQIQMMKQALNEL